MKKSSNDRYNVFKMVVISLMVAIGVVISPILRVEGMCPTAHLINITAAVLMGPWYALLIAVFIGVIRMTLMSIPPLALTGAVFGAFLSGVFYRISKGKIIYAVLGEVIGTGIIGAIVSYPVMALIMGRTGLTWAFYVPGFTCATLMGGSVAYIFLKALNKNGQLIKFQKKLGSHTLNSETDSKTESLGISIIGVIVLIVALIFTKLMLKMNGPLSVGFPFAAFLLIEIVAAYNLKAHSNKSKGSL